MIGLRSATGFIRSQIGKSVRLRYVPEITFEYDKSADYSARIYEILAGWEKQDKGNG
jgi:ribosome-binding factor A